MGQAFGCYKVEESKVAMMEHFGKFVDVLEPRCHCLPWCLRNPIADRLALRIRQLDVKCHTKTKDNVFVIVAASIQYRAVADKPSDAFSKLTNTKEQIKSYVFDVIGGSVPKLELDCVFEQKNDIARAIEDELAKVMSNYGYEIVHTLIVDIERDVKVKKARNAVARMRLAANEKAEASLKYYKKAYSKACTSPSSWV